MRDSTLSSGVRVENLLILLTVVWQEGKGRGEDGQVDGAEEGGRIGWG